MYKIEFRNKEWALIDENEEQIFSSILVDGVLLKAMFAGLNFDQILLCGLDEWKQSQEEEKEQHNQKEQSRRERAEREQRFQTEMKTIKALGGVKQREIFGEQYEKQEKMTWGNNFEQQMKKIWGEKFEERLKEPPIEAYETRMREIWGENAWRLIKELLPPTIEWNKFRGRLNEALAKVDREKAWEPIELPPEEYDDGWTRFVYFPKGLMELNNEFDKEIKRMEKKKRN